MSMEDGYPDAESPRVASMYALDRLRRAILTATSHADPQKRRQAEEKALAWESVLDGMASGRLEIGSRTPVENTPAWVTLEVAHGGFATGRYLAETLDTLQQVTLLAYTSFPHTILPNPLLTEIAALAKQADLDVLLVEEIAADIFMGTFTPKWQRAAAVAAAELDESLYGRYYSLRAASHWPPDSDPPAAGSFDRARQRWGKPVAEGFGALCKARAKEAATGDGSWVARNGALIEQSQILTTQNLAPVVAALDLRPRLTPRSLDLATSVFNWVVRQQNTQWNHWRAELQMT